MITNLIYLPQLCLACKRLDLAESKFIVSTLSSSNGPAVHNDPFKGKSHDDPNQQPWSSSGDGFSCPQRSLQDYYRQRHGCQFCDLVLRAIERYSKHIVSLTAQISLAWEVDGRQKTEIGKLLSRTRRLRLWWPDQDDKATSVYFILIAPSEPRASPTGTIKAVNPHFLARAPIKVPEKQALMKSWVDLCVNHHGAICKETHSAKADYKKLVSSTFFGVVDVVDMQLKSLPFVNGEPERYVALSYVWGKRSPGRARYVTTRSNVMVRIQHGGLEKSWDRLPKTIQDVILLVGRLGERYVWIDSLCIVQDSMTSWEHNAKAMHLVYGNAHLTVCAADGDALTGLRAISSALKRVENEKAQPNLNAANISQPGGPRERANNTIDEAQLGPVTGEVLPGIKLLTSKPPEAVIQDSQWNQRGWTFQERLLSRRCLIFAEGKVYFQCRSSVTSEDIISHGSSEGWSLDWTNSPLRTLGELRRRAFWFYMRCVSLYTGRLLSKSKDVLTAFQGTSWLLQRHLNAPLFWGLPASHFDFALLWSPVDVLKRRQRMSSHQSDRGSYAIEDTDKSKSMIDEDDFGDQEFPSWSWCGWLGAGCEYKSDMLEGSFLNVNEWLRTHTWILWYIRDFEGNLRPLWDKSVLKEDVSEKTSWRGYRGRTSARSTSPSFSNQHQRIHREESDSQYAQKSMPRPKRSSLRRPGVPHSTKIPHDPLTPSIDQLQGSNYPSPRPHQPTESIHIPFVVPPAPPGPHPIHKARAWKESCTERKSPDDSEGPQRAYKPSTGTDADEKGWSRQSNRPYLERVRSGYYKTGDESDGDARLNAMPFSSGIGMATSSGAQYESSAAKHSTATYQGLTNFSHTPASHRPPYDPPSAPASYPAPGYYPPYAYTYTPSYYPSYSYNNIPAYYSTSTYHPINMNHAVPHHDQSEQRPKRRQRAKVRVQEPVPDSEQTLSESEASIISDKVDSGRGSIRASSPQKGDQARKSARISERSGPQGVKQMDTKTDPYGRPPGSNVGKETRFRSIIPENPFGIISGPYPNNPQELLKGMPVLQFWTWWTECVVKPRASDSVSTAVNILSHYDVHDKSGDWCGSVCLPLDFIADHSGQVFKFIAISDAKSFTKDECPLWNYYVPKEREDSEWDLYHVLMLRRNRERALWERVALGKIFQAAFADAQWYEVKLG